MEEKKFRATQAINYLIYKGVADSQKEVGEKIGYGESYFSQIINGKKALSDTVLKKIASLDKELNLSWLLTGEGEMLIDKSTTLRGAYLMDEEEYKKAEEKGLTLVPEYANTFKGGNTGELITQDNIAAYWGFPHHLKADIVTEIDGNSMAPRFPSGSKVALREIAFDPHFPNSGIPFGEAFGIILDSNDEYLSFVKILRRHSDPELAKRFWIAQSVNTTEYDDFDVDITKVRHLFVVVASVTLSRY